MDSVKYARSKFEYRRHFGSVADPDVYPGPGSRGQKGTGSPIRIRKTAFGISPQNRKYASSRGGGWGN